jgi:hypothetical protein
MRKETDEERGHAALPNPELILFELCFTELNASLSLRIIQFSFPSAAPVIAYRLPGEWAG